MERIRILLGEIPQELGDNFKQAVAAQPDMELVGEVRNGVDLLLAAGHFHADVVVLGIRDSELPGICSHLLDEYPHINVLAVGTNGQQAFLYKSRPCMVSLNEISPEALLAAIRSAVCNN